MVRTHDTSRTAADLQLQLQAGLGAGERILRVFEASTFAREFARATLRACFPAFTEDEINHELVRQLYGETRRIRER